MTVRGQGGVWLDAMGSELETLLDALAMPVFFKDRQLRFRRVNRAYCEFVGCPPECVLGLTAKELFSPELAEQFEAEDRAVLESGMPLVSPDQRVADGRGTLHYFSTYKAPVRNAQGEIVGLVGLATDVTERRLAEAERLTVLRRQRDALVREVHHRIKNHLQGVAGLLHRSIATHPALAGPLRSVLTQVESIAGIHGLQSRLGTQRLNAGQVVEMVSRLAPESVAVDVLGVTACLHEEDAVPFALTVNELISNAVKHRQPGEQGAVCVRASQSSDGVWVEISSRPARLPPDFDFVRGCGLGTGLRLVRTLLPREGARLEYRQEGDMVTAEFRLARQALAVDVGPAALGRADAASEGNAPTPGPVVRKSDD